MAYSNTDPVNRGWQATAQVANNAIPLAGTAKTVSDVASSVPGAWQSFSKVANATPTLTQTAANKLASSAGLNGTSNSIGSSIANWAGPALVAYDYAKTGLTDALNRDLSDWRNGAATGASLGSVAGPLGTVTGAVVGGLTGLAGSAAGIGKTKNKGYSPVSGTYNQNGNMSLLGVKGTGAKRYNSYNDAMNYLNGVNQQWNPEWSKIGDSERGQYDLATKMADPYSTEAMVGLVSGGLPGFIGGSILGSKKKHDYVDAYKANLNTGYNVMDDFTNGRNYSGDTWNLDSGWKPYQAQQDAIFQDRLGNLTKADKEGIVSGMRNNAYDLAQQVDQQQYDKAKKTLDAQLTRGYMNQSQYQAALRQLNQNRVANIQSLNDIGSSQIDQWKSDVRQAYDNKLDNDLTDAWIKNYDAWKSNDLSGLYGRANEAANAYINNMVSDDYLKNLMSQTDTYLPQQYMATGVANNIDDNLGRWYSGRQKRVAPVVYQGG